MRPCELFSVCTAGLFVASALVLFVLAPLDAVLWLIPSFLLFAGALVLFLL